MPRRIKKIFTNTGCRVVVVFKVQVWQRGGGTASRSRYLTRAETKEALTSFVILSIIGISIRDPEHHSIAGLVSPLPLGDDIDSCRLGNHLADENG